MTLLAKNTGTVLGGPNTPLAICDINHQVKAALEQQYERVWLTGEISNCACPRSGHYYFSLKDKKAQLACVLFQQYTVGMTMKPENGCQVVVCGKLTLYEPRGQFQLQVYQCIPMGDGQLQQAFHQLKQRLTQLGFFAAEHKKTLPRIPHCIGLITSPSGAALQDMLAVIRRRFAGISLIIYPAVVQGKSSVASLVSAIHAAQRQALCDVLIVARGGGSLEDLWSFNEVALVEAIYACPIPIVSGVGHETDITLCDYVADKRAVTPSAAAAMVVPDSVVLLQQINHNIRAMLRGVKHSLMTWTLLIEKSMHSHNQLLVQLPSWNRFVHHVCQRIIQRLQTYFYRQQKQIEHKIQILYACHPQQRISLYEHRCQLLHKRLIHRANYVLLRWKNHYDYWYQRLYVLNPEYAFKRGYALLLKDSTMGSFAADHKTLAVGQRYGLYTQQGLLVIEVLDKKNKDK
tara:strand:- start:1124 stop:2503 length:1380 start_codon:yes stop_codon:yes gene_type:complete